MRIIIFHILEKKANLLFKAIKIYVRLEMCYTTNISVLEKLFCGTKIDYRRKEYFR